MTEFDLALHYKKSIINKNYFGDCLITESISLVQEMLNLGFIPSKDLFILIDKNLINCTKLYSDLIPSLQILVGDNAVHKPMYPNFPEQVANISDYSLYFNAMAHYFTFGEWLPDFVVELRSKDIEPNVKFKEIGIIEEQELYDILNKIPLSPDSLTSYDKEVIQWMLDENHFIFNGDYLKEITFAETRCIVLNALLSHNDLRSFCELMNNITDVLRVCTYISGGDISLAKNTKFKNLKRPERRLLSKALETFWDDETASRHKNKWIKLLHNLHVGDYSDVLWYKVKNIRENHKIETFNGNVEDMIIKMNINGLVNLLKQRPSEFARRLDHTLRICDDKIWVIGKFLDIIDKVPTKIIIQLIGHFENRTTEKKTVVLPKGQMSKAVLIDQKGEINKPFCKSLVIGLRVELRQRFSELDKIDQKVWIDPDLKKCPVPSGMRSVTPGLITVPRGTRYDFGNDSTIRFFIYWVGQDIDLSATFHDENFKIVERVSYTNLRSGELKAYHSGDITNAHSGASEFIDINIEAALKKARYVAMNVFVYSGPNFSEHEEAFVGWMGRDKPKSNEIYEPKTVKQKIDLVNESRYVCPVMFDLKERKAIFVDMTKKENYNTGGNNVESNQAGIEDILYSTVNQNKMDLFTLFEDHCIMRSKEIVENKEDAEFTFGVQDCDITPESWLEIQTDWMV